MLRDKAQKTKAQGELNLAKDAKSKKKGFSRFIRQKRKAKESVQPLMNTDWQTGNSTQGEG